MVLDNEPLWREKIKVAYILAEVRYPASRRLISECCGVDEDIVQKVLHAWRQFLHCQAGLEPVYTIYHTSFRDFLRRDDIIRSAGITLQEIHGRIRSYQRRMLNNG